MIRHTAVAIALTLAPAAFAQTYIVPDGDCGATTLHVTRGGETIATDQVKTAYVFLPSREKVVVKSAAHSLDFDATVPQDGVAMASVDLTPVISGNETRTEHAKTMIFCSAKPPMADWQRSTGLGLEIYPQEWNGRRPRLKAGDSMSFIAVDAMNEKDKLLRDISMELYRAGGGRIAQGFADQYGFVKFPFPDPGRYMVTTTYRRPDSQQPEHWLVDTSTLTFEIK